MVPVRLAKALFPWAALGGEVSARWLWAFRGAWGIGLLMWASSADRAPRGLLSLLVLFLLVGNSLHAARVIKSRALETVAIFVFSLLFINGATAFLPTKGLLALLTGQAVTSKMLLYGVGFHAAALLFAAMWVLLLRHWRAMNADL